MRGRAEGSAVKLRSPWQTRKRLASKDRGRDRGRGRFRSTTNPFIRTRSPFVPAPRRRSDVWFSASRWLPQRAQSTS